MVYRVRASGQLYVRPIQGPLNLLRKLLQSNLSPWRLRGRKFRMWYSPDLIRQPRTLHTVRLSGGRETGAHARRHSRVIRPWRGEWQSSSFSLLIFHFIIITVIRNPDNKTWQYILLPKLNHQRAQHSQRLGQIAVEWVGQQLGDAMQIVVKYAYNNIVLIIFVITSKGKRAFKWERCNSNKDVLYRSGPWQSSTVTVALYCWVKCEFTERPPDVWRRWGDRQEGRPERPTGGVDWTQDGVHHGQDIRSGRWVACMWVAEQGTSRQLNPSSYRSVVGLGSNGIDMETLLLIKWWWLMAIIHIVLI